MQWHCVARCRKICLVTNRTSSFEQVNVNLKVPGKKLEHHGIKIEFVGQIGEKLFVILHCIYLTCSCHYPKLCGVVNLF